MLLARQMPAPTVRRAKATASEQSSSTSYLLSTPTPGRWMRATRLMRLAYSLPVVVAKKMWCGGRLLLTLAMILVRVEHSPAPPRRRRRFCGRECDRDACAFRAVVSRSQSACLCVCFGLKESNERLA